MRHILVVLVLNDILPRVDNLIRNWYMNLYGLKFLLAENLGELEVNEYLRWQCLERRAKCTSTPSSLLTN